MDTLSLACTHAHAKLVPKVSNDLPRSLIRELNTHIDSKLMRGSGTSELINTNNKFDSLDKIQMTDHIENLSQTVRD